MAREYAVFSGTCLICRYTCRTAFIFRLQIIAKSFFLFCFYYSLCSSPVCFVVPANVGTNEYPSQTCDMRALLPTRPPCFQHVGTVILSRWGAPLSLSRKVAPVGAALSFTLRSKGEAGQLCYLIIQALAIHFRTPLPYWAPQPCRFLNPKHCNLRGFCRFGMETRLLATRWKLRTYQSVFLCVFASCCPRNTVNTVVFASSGKTVVNTMVFGFWGSFYTVDTLLQTDDVARIQFTNRRCYAQKPLHGATRSSL